MNTKREKIIEATCRLMEVQGYHATGLNQILRESGTPKGSLYHYFPEGKEELAETAIMRRAELVENRIRESLEGVDDPADAVRNFIREVAQLVADSDYTQGGPLTTLALEVAGFSDRLTGACEEAYQTWQRAFADKIAEKIHSRSEVNRLAHMIICSIEGGIVLCRTERDSAPLEDVAEELHTLIKHHMNDDSNANRQQI